MSSTKTTGEFSETQTAMANRIAEADGREEMAQELLKWALARITFYGPSDEPCAQVIREFLDTGKVSKR